MYWQAGGKAPSPPVGEPRSKTLFLMQLAFCNDFFIFFISDISTMMRLLRRSVHQQ